MSEYTYVCIQNKSMDITDFYTIETPPPSSSTSKDSIDESIFLFQTKQRLKLMPTNLAQISNQSNPITVKTDEVRYFF